MGSASTDFSKLLGKTVNFNLLPTGKIDNLVGFDKLPSIRTATGETITEDLYKLGIRSTFFNLPNRPVKIGDDWTEMDTTKIPLTGGTRISEDKSTYKVLEEVKKDGHDCLKIETTRTQKLTGELEQNGQPLSIDRETKSKGTIYFAYQIGMFLSMDVSSEADGLITVVGA